MFDRYVDLSSDGCQIDLFIPATQLLHIYCELGLMLFGQLDPQFSRAPDKGIHPARALFHVEHFRLLSHTVSPVML